MSNTVKRIDPLTMGDQIKALFVNNERPEFPGWFDRAYPMAVKEGAASWVLVDPENRVLAHVGGFHTRLLVEGRELRGGLLVNLMADKDHRTFFPVVSVIKRAVKDMKADGAEFIYTNPINPGAIATMKAGGLGQIGDSNRFLLVLGHSNPVVDLGVTTIARARRAWLPRVNAHQVDLAEAVRWTTEEVAGVSAVTPRRLASLYPIRQENFGVGQDLGIRLTDKSGAVVGAAIVRMPPAPAPSTLTTLRCTGLDRVAGSVTAVGALLRDLGVKRLQGGALMNTPFAKELQRGGFLLRKEPWAVVSAGFTDQGRTAAAGLATSDLEVIDLD
jgi:hypothetical protein